MFMMRPAEAIALIFTREPSEVLMRESVFSTYRRKRLGWASPGCWLIAGRAGRDRARSRRRQATAVPPAAQYVIQISVDGLGSAWLEPLLKAGELPNFERLEREGAWTHNARTDYDMTITLPNHTCMVTGRPVQDRVIGDRAVAGHLWTVNTDDQPENLHGNRHGYIASTFDVAHDHGLRTATVGHEDQIQDLRQLVRRRQRGRRHGRSRQWPRQDRFLSDQRGEFAGPAGRA